MTRTKGFSGKYGTVKYSTGTGLTLTGSGTVLYEVTGWDFDPKSAIPKHASNYTAGFKSGVAGTRDSSGKIEVVIPSNASGMLQDGDSVVLALHADASGSNYFLVPALIEGAPVAVNVDSGDAVKVTFNFQGDGAWTGYGIFAHIS